MLRVANPLLGGLARPALYHLAPGESRTGVRLGSRIGPRLATGEAISKAGRARKYRYLRSKLISAVVSPRPTKIPPLTYRWTRRKRRFPRSQPARLPASTP